jgi:membrane associated rhomboid family serine protease
MREIDLQGGIVLDGCVECGGLWIDAGDLTRLQRRRPGQTRKRLQGLGLRVAEAQHEADEKAALVGDTEQSAVLLWLVQFFLGIPVEVYSPVCRRPIATYVLIALNVLAFAVVFLWQPGTQESIIGTFGFVPANFVRRVAPWTILTSMFVHTDYLHLAGNMYFLWVFGDNVEDRLGAGEYLSLYFLGGIGSTLAHVAADPASVIPAVGASGAIAAILGAYMYLFPYRRFYFMIFITLREVAAILYLGVWLALQFAFAALDVEGVGWWAHIGGFAVGATAAALHRAALRRRIAELEWAIG